MSGLNQTSVYADVDDELEDNRHITTNNDEIMVQASKYTSLCYINIDTAKYMKIK
jgi:hypothetical protein